MSPAMYSATDRSIYTVLFTQQNFRKKVLSNRTKFLKFYYIFGMNSVLAKYGNMPARCTRLFTGLGKTGSKDATGTTSCDTSAIMCRLISATLRNAYANSTAKKRTVNPS